MGGWLRCRPPRSFPLRLFSRQDARPLANHPERRAEDTIPKPFGAIRLASGPGAPARFTLHVVAPSDWPPVCGLRTRYGTPFRDRLYRSPYGKRQVMRCPLPMHPRYRPASAPGGCRPHSHQLKRLPLCR